jgi:hypothetical protein
LLVRVTNSWLPQLCEIYAPQPADIGNNLVELMA